MIRSEQGVAIWICWVKTRISENPRNGCANRAGHESCGWHTTEKDHHGGDNS